MDVDLLGCYYFHLSRDHWQFPEKAENGVDHNNSSAFAFASGKKQRSLARIFDENSCEEHEKVMS